MTAPWDVKAVTSPSTREPMRCAARKSAKSASGLTGLSSSSKRHRRLEGRGGRLGGSLGGLGCGLLRRGHGLLGDAFFAWHGSLRDLLRRSRRHSDATSSTLSVLLRRPSPAALVGLAGCLLRGAFVDFTGVNVVPIDGFAPSESVTESFFTGRDGLRVAHGKARREDPADAAHRLAADQSTLVEEPRILLVELLEGVVAQDDALDPVGDLQDEGVASTNGAGRRRHDLAGQFGLFEVGPLVRSRLGARNSRRRPRSSRRRDARRGTRARPRRAG